MLFLIQLAFLNDPIFTYDTDLEINIFNPQIMIQYDQTYEFLPIDYTYKDKYDNEITVEGVYIHNSTSCVGGDDNGVGCVAQNPQFIIEGNVTKIVANTSMTKLLNRDSVSQVQLDMYAGAKQLTYNYADYQYFVSSIYKECILTKNADYNPEDTSSYIRIQLSDPYFRIPTKIYEYINVQDYEFIQTSYCTSYHTENISSILENTGNVYFATYGILQLLESNGDIAPFSQLKMKLTNETEAMDYVTPFSINFTEVQVESIDITQSVVYGRQFDRKVDYVFINTIDINDTGYHHVYENLCIMILQDEDRDSVLYVDGSEEAMSFTTAEIMENGEAYYTPGLICGTNLQFRPLDMINTEDEDLMRDICNLNNEQNRNLDFVQEYCSDYVFIGKYVIYLTTILCGFCAVCIATYLVNQILILKIAFGRDFETYLIAIVLMAVCIMNAIIIMLCSNPLPVIIPGVGTIVLMMYNYLLTTETEFYNDTILTRYEIYKYGEQLQVTAGFVISIILATIIQSALSVFEIILAMSDVFQMLQFFKINVVSAEDSIIIYPSIVILDAIDNMLEISSWLFLPFLAVFFALQYVTRSQWFIDKLPQIPGNATKYIFDWRGFGIKICFTLFKFYCNFVGLIMCNYMSLVFNLESGPTVDNVITVFVFSCYLYSFSKFSMFPQWCRCFWRTLRAFFADCGILFLLLSDVIFSLVGCIVGPIYISKSKDQNTRKAYASMWIWFLKTLGFFVLQPILMFLRLAIFALYPCFIFLSEFVPPYFFIIQAMGMIPHQEEINNVYNDMVTESLPSVILRFLTYIFSYMLISLITFVQQDLTSWYICQSFSVVFIAVIIQRYWSQGSHYFYRTTDKYFRNYTLVPWHKHGEQRLQLILETMYQQTNFRVCTVDFQNIQANYSTEVQYLESYLQDQLMNCYQFIPGIGPLLGIVAEYMNGPPLVESGELDLSGIFFFNYLHFGSAIGMIMCYVNNPDSFAYYILLGIYVFCQVLDAYDEAIEITNHENMGLQRLFPCFQKVRIQFKNAYYAKRKIQLNSYLVNQIYLQDEILQQMKTDGAIDIDEQYPSIGQRLKQIQDTKLEQAKIDAEIAIMRNLGVDEDISKLRCKIQIMEDRMNEIIQLKQQVNKHTNVVSMEEGERSYPPRLNSLNVKSVMNNYISTESSSPGSNSTSILKKITSIGIQENKVEIANIDDQCGNSQYIEDV